MLYEKIELEPNEEVLKVVRKHWFVIATELVGTFLILLFPFFMLFIAALFPKTLLNVDIGIEHFTTLIAFGMPPGAAVYHDLALQASSEGTVSVYCARRCRQAASLNCRWKTASNRRLFSSHWSMGMSILDNSGGRSPAIAPDLSLRP